MRYLLILAILLPACGGYAPWQADGNTYLDFSTSDDYERWGEATVEKQPQGRVFIHIQESAPDYEEAIIAGLQMRGDTHGEEIRVLEPELWLVAEDAVIEANIREGYERWPMPVSHVRWD